MARRRGFFAEMAHQSAVAEKNRQRTQAAAVRDQAQRKREAERAERSYQQALRAAERADTQASAQLQREMKQAQIAAQEAEVERLNGDLALQLADIDNVLTATLEVDDYVDLETLRQVAEHPPFSSPHATPIAAPSPVPVPVEPVFLAPDAPRGISAVFGKKKHEEAVADAQVAHSRAHDAWRQAAAAVPMQQFQQLSDHQRSEQAREVRLSSDRARYDAECAARQADIDEANALLDQLITDLQRGTPEAVEEYFGIVFGNSVYPADWPWPPSYRYDADTSELAIDLRFPAPGDLPTVRSYKYVRASDEITSTAQTQKEQKDRFAALMANMTLRTLHEVWESDRVARVSSISLTGLVDHVDAATGNDTATPLIAVAVARATFQALELSRVAPAETLRHLGAVVSKNPWALTAISLSSGVRVH